MTAPRLISRIPGEGANVIPYDLSATPGSGSVGEYLALQMAFRTRATAAAAFIPTVVNRINLLFFDNNEIEGSAAVYRRVDSEPAHPGKFQSSGGQWWELHLPRISPEMFGAIGNGDVANMVADTYGCQNAFDASAALGRPVVCPPATYIIDMYKGAQPVWTNAGRWGLGGLILPAGATLIGAGKDRTIFKNGADNARVLLRVRNSGRSTIRGITLDPDFPTRNAIPYGPPTSTTGGGGSGGLLYEGGGGAVMDIIATDIHVRNTGGYAIGLQNVGIASALIDTISFEKIGADCIDIKSYPASNQAKKGVIRNISAPDGCGWNFVAVGEEGGHNDQAVIDIGGSWHVSGVEIGGLTSFSGSTGNTGIRFRSAVLADGRAGAEGSTLTGFHIVSSKAQGVGTNAEFNIIGLAIYSADVSISNGTIENCRTNLLEAAFGAAENPDPRDVTISGVRCLNANDATTTGYNFRLSASSVRSGLVGCRARGGDIGLRLDGSGAAFTDMKITSCALGIQATAVQWRNHGFANILLEGNTADTDVVTELPGSTTIMNKRAAIVGNRQAFLDMLAIVDDNNWTGDDSYLGGIRFRTRDSTAGGPIEVARLACQSVGASGGTYTIAVSYGGVNVFQVRSNMVRVAAQAIPDYADSAAAIADATLLSGALYRITSTNAVFWKP